jgi:DNA invertase Pin-like site-specific DNA recombinase
MAEGKWVSYLRVSTDRQGKSGLGIEAQRKAVDEYLNGGNWQLVREFVEVESGKREDNRPMLEAAFKACRIHRATLVIAKLDRLSRDAHFLLGLQKAGVEFVCVDDPHMTPLTLGIRAVVAQHERELISTRTKAALAAAKARGVKLGGNKGFTPTKAMNKLSAKVRGERADTMAQDLAPIIKDLQAAGKTTLRGIAAGLNEQRIPTSRGGEWSSSQVMRLLERIDPFRGEEKAAA